MALSSSSAQYLSHSQGYELQDRPNDVSLPRRSGKLSSDYELPSKMHYLSITFQLLTRTLAILGLISLGLQVSEALRARRSSVLPSQVSLPTPSQCPHEDVYKIDGYHPETLPPRLSLCDCGSTIGEALLRNCTYDTLSTAWLPPYCRDDELTAEFDMAGPGPEGAWEYFADEEGKVPLDRTQVAALGETGGSFWASRNWHIVHCLFYWQKYHRMRYTNIIMEERFDSLHHVKHCGRLIRNPTPDHLFLIEVPVMMNSSKDI